MLYNERCINLTSSHSVDGRPWKYPIIIKSNNIASWMLHKMSCHFQRSLRGFYGIYSSTETSWIWLSEQIYWKEDDCRNSGSKFLFSKHRRLIDIKPFNRINTANFGQFDTFVWKSDWIIYYITFLSVRKSRRYVLLRCELELNYARASCFTRWWPYWAIGKGGPRTCRRRGRQPLGGEPTQYIYTFSEKPHEFKEILSVGGGARQQRPLNPPLIGALVTTFDSLPEEGEVFNFSLQTLIPLAPPPPTSRAI